MIDSESENQGNDEQRLWRSIPEHIAKPAAQRQVHQARDQQENATNIECDVREDH
jgi:hypothetical protein